MDLLDARRARRDPVDSWRSLSATHAAIHAALDSALRHEHDLSAVEFEVLERIAACSDGKARMQELSAAAHLTQSTALARRRAARGGRARRAARSAATTGAASSPRSPRRGGGASRGRADLPAGDHGAAQRRLAVDREVERPRRGCPSSTSRVRNVICCAVPFGAAVTVPPSAVADRRDRRDHGALADVLAKLTVYRPTAELPVTRGHAPVVAGHAGRRHGPEDRCRPDRPCRPCRPWAAGPPRSPRP